MIRRLILLTLVPTLIMWSAATMILSSCQLLKYICR